MPSELDQIRDELARELGWEKIPAEGGGFFWMKNDCKSFWDHPVHDSLDSIAVCMPANVRVDMDADRMYAVRPLGGDIAQVLRTGDEKLDRAKLALLAIGAGKEKR